MRGKPKGVVSWFEKGRRFRPYFPSYSAAKLYANEAIADVKDKGSRWIGIPLEQRIELVDVYKQSTVGGYTVKEALDFYESQRNAKPKERNPL